MCLCACVCVCGVSICIHLCVCQLEPSRAASFIKRVLAVCLCQPPHMTLALLVVVRSLLEAVPATQQLFDVSAVWGVVWWMCVCAVV